MRLMWRKRVTTSEENGEKLKACLQDAPPVFDNSRDDTKTSEILAKQEQQSPESDSDDEGDDNEALRAELADIKDKHLRVLAEFENYKKRVFKERADIIKYQGERIFVDLLDIVDNFDRAIAHLDADTDQLKTGVQLIHKAFQEFLKKWEVRGESAIGQPFDPYRHNALSRVSTDTVPSGVVIDELKKCFHYKDKVIRPGEVVVATSPSEQQ